MSVKIPYFKQKKWYTCGAACARMILASAGIKKSEQVLSKQLKINNIDGTLTKNLILLFKKYNFKTISKQNSSISELKNLLKNNYFIILLFFIEKENIDHFTIVRKITKTRIFLLDSHLGKNKKFKISQFNKIWHSDSRFEKKKKWFLALKLV